MNEIEKTLAAWGCNKESFPLKAEHHRIMSSLGLDIDFVIKIRHWIH